MEATVKKFGKDAYDLFHYSGNCPVCKSIVEFFKGQMKPIIHYTQLPSNAIVTNNKALMLKNVSLAIRCPVCGTYMNDNFDRLEVKVEDMLK